MSYGIPVLSTGSAEVSTATQSTETRATHTKQKTQSSRRHTKKLESVKPHAVEVDSLENTGTGVHHTAEDDRQGISQPKPSGNFSRKRDGRRKGWGKSHWQSKRGPSSRTSNLDNSARSTDTYDQMHLPDFEEKAVEITTHSSDFNQSVVVPNSQVFPQVVDGDLLKVESFQNSDSHLKQPNSRLISQMTGGTLSLSGKVGVSILDEAANAHGLRKGMKVKLGLADLKESLLEFVEVGLL